jgi:hypothetical protein
MKQKRISIQIIILLSILLSACSAGSEDSQQVKSDFTNLKRLELPSSEGYYYIDERDFFLIPKTSEINLDFHQIPLISSDNAEFIAYGSSFDQNMINLFDHTGKQYPLNFAEPVDLPDSEFIKLFQFKPASPLPDGFYCLTDEFLINPSAFSTYFDDNYCFALGDVHRLGLDSTRTSVDLPPGKMGFYILNNGNFEFIPSTKLNEEIDINSLPTTNKLLPTILFQSDSESPDYVGIYWRRPMIGVSFGFMGDDGTVSSVEPGLGAEAAGIQEGDKIIGINGTDISNYSLRQIQAIISNSCIAGSTIETTILRGTQTYIANPTCSLGGGDSLDYLSFTINPKGYAEFSIGYPLYPNNVYCMYIRSSNEKSCFLVQ